MRVALFGGTFDPPHRGHLSIARAAADRFCLDSVLFTPVGRQPLKPDGAHAGYEDRVCMLSLACVADSRFEVSRLDAPQGDGAANYTVDTLAALHRLRPQATLFNLVGADSFLGLRRWRQPTLLLELAEWIVVSRPGFSLEDLSELELSGEQKKKIHLLETVHEDVAATVLRRRLEEGDACRDVLPGAVSEYIANHCLYG